MAGVSTPSQVRIVFDRIPQIAANLQSSAGRAVSKAAHDVQAQAQAACPVDTGHLQGSIQASQVKPFHWRVVVGAEYGIYVEMGTRHMAAQPYFYPAIHRVGPQMIAALNTLVTRSTPGPAL